MSGEGVSNPADLAGVTASLATILAVVQDTNADLVVVDANVDDILAVTNALPTLTTALGSATTTVLNTEYNLYINNTPLGVYKPILLKVWMLNHTATETIVLRPYYRLTNAGVWVEQDEVTVAGLPAEEEIDIELAPTRWGVRVTIERTAGTAREYPWEVFYEI